MDKIQPFVKDYLLSSSGKDPSVIEQRLYENLKLLPTKKEKKSKTNRKNIRKKTGNKLLGLGSKKIKKSLLKQENYKKLNHDSRKRLRQYIIECKRTARIAHGLINKEIKRGNLTDNDKGECHKYLKEAFSENYIRLFPKFCALKKGLYENLWLPYIKELLRITDKRSLEKLNVNVCLQKLSIADYNGSYLKVIKTKNRSVSGIGGIVLWEAQKSFIMLCEGKLIDEIKIIPKDGTVFEICLPLDKTPSNKHTEQERNEEDVDDNSSVVFSIIGDRFKYRSSDRSGRKFKSKRCDDLFYYLLGSENSTSS
ncbi:RNase P/RNase MRP complex subunit SCDLUD_004672 [Saccharomycodes ludwigii]|uniref:RNase P/RNase MRP complex subunit n=1 Tax=Saccharomycodes ludwigii TaxID=36035 RepID=UPI001E883F32|nr:hypothetical protein SCDLUD_004672 [Saccharomycodes ludwigii]KAH3899239.1 hypothetical protein SCDLUD_004672 [Saccharomycodes ludwigii]